MESEMSKDSDDDQKRSQIVAGHYLSLEAELLYHPMLSEQRHVESKGVDYSRSEDIRTATNEIVYGLEDVCLEQLHNHTKPKFRNNYNYNVGYFIVVIIRLWSLPRSVLVLERSLISIRKKISLISLCRFTGMTG